MSVADQLIDGDLWHRNCANLIRVTASTFAGTGTFSSNNYSLNLSPNPIRLQNGDMFRITPGATNTGNVTITVSAAIGSKSLRNAAGQQIAAGLVVSGCPITAQYDSANDWFVLVSNSNDGIWRSFTPTGSGVGTMTWTVTINECFYAYHGGSVELQLRLTGTTAGTADVSLAVSNLPRPAAVVQQGGAGHILNNVREGGYWYFQDVNTIYVRRIPTANWSLGADRGIQSTLLYRGA